MKLEFSCHSCSACTFNPSQQMCINHGSSVSTIFFNSFRHLTRSTFGFYIQDNMLFMKIAMCCWDNSHFLYSIPIFFWVLPRIISNVHILPTISAKVCFSQLFQNSSSIYPYSVPKPHYIFSNCWNVCFGLILVFISTFLYIMFFGNFTNVCNFVCVLIIYYLKKWFSIYG